MDGNRTEDLSADNSGNAEIEEDTSNDAIVNNFSDSVKEAHGDVVEQARS